MSFTNKIDSRTLSLVLIALIGGVMGGYLSGATTRSSQIESLSNAFTAQLDTKDTEIATLSDAMSSLEEQLSQLEASAAEPVIGFNTPDYDSGWIEIEPDSYVNLNHNLGTTNLFVYLVGGYKANEYDTHQIAIGGDVYYIPFYDAADSLRFLERHDGIFWRTNGVNTIRVSRLSENINYNWPRFRVLLWMLPEPPVVMMP